MSGKHLNQQDLQLVVLGPIESAKTSVITTVLGQRTEYESGKKTGDCVKREGQVGGRKLTFIDTPGWVGYFPSTDTAEVIKHKIVLSVYMCRPGPHAFILVVGTNTPFTEKNRRSIEEHLGLFGDKVWDHTIVVFARGEPLESKSIEQHIESEGEALKWVVEKCGNRCHMFYTDSTEGCNEVRELLEQIDILAKARNSFFKLDEKILREVEEKRNNHRERAKMRQQKVMDEREMLCKYGVIPSLSELRILLLGWLISGKTSAKDTILGQVDRVNKKRTYQSERTSGEVSGRQVSVVDTPGWWKYLPAKCTPEWMKTELQRGLTLDSKAPHAILLAVPADTTFHEEQRKNIEDNMKMFGEQVWKHTMVLFTCGDRLEDTSIEEHIESEGQPLQWLVEKCGNRYHILSWNDKEEEVMELLKKIEEMMASLCLFRPEPESQTCIDKKTTEDLIEVPNEMVHFLDQKWQKMDRELEEKIVTICGETTSKLKGSMDAVLDFNGSTSEDTLEEINSGKCISPLSPPESKSSIRKSGIINATIGHEDQEQTHENHAGQMERMKEMLEREWGRREASVTQRFQRQISALKESGSEADVHDLDRSFKKVVWWVQRESSGIASDVDAEEMG
ncbi:hypothetical protein AALO_G00099690 [Alosa alosa]|uniref:AIG1-type G domain-containing protein n=1 Tax=Alosa alosa TaxID=278164 RepID=A0AAV6GXW4_9TELE|nr:uncharacterized protein LOC125297828 [Alosa alosa]KAG5278502.1 hypothetical protein AALO_G00099690 [Alosa alosa]